MRHAKLSISFNRLTGLLTSISVRTRVIALASRRTGAGVATGLLDLIVLERLRTGQTDMEALLRQIDPGPEHVDQVRQMLDDSVNKRMPFLRAAGVF